MKTGCLVGGKKPANLEHETFCMIDQECVGVGCYTVRALCVRDTGKVIDCQGSAGNEKKNLYFPCMLLL